MIFKISVNRDKKKSTFSLKEAKIWTVLAGKTNTPYSFLFVEQTLDGVGTESDDLALKVEEEKQRMKDKKKRFEKLPNDGGEEIMIRFL